MDQTLYAWLYLNESPKIGHPRHHAVHAITRLQRKRIPRVRQKLLHAHRDTLLLGVNLKNFDLDLLAYRKHVFRLVDPAPGDLTHMEQRIHTAYIHERSIASEAAHLAVHRFALFELTVPALFGGTLFLFRENATVHHHVFFGDFQFDDPTPDLLPHQFFQLRSIARAAARGRQKSPHANIHSQSALHQAGHRS